MESLRRLCYENLMRFPTEDETLYLKRSGADKRWSDEHYLEAQIALLTKDYQGMICDLSQFRLLVDVGEARAFYAFLMDIFNRMLYKNPLVSDIGQFLVWAKMHGVQTAKNMVESWIREQNEYKFQTECLETLISWSTAPASTRKPGGLRVRFYGPYGTSGYARACRDIVRCLAVGSTDLTFVPLTVQEFNSRDNNPENITLSNLLEVKDVANLQGAGYDAVDLVVIHSVPDLWQPVIRREKAANPNVKTIGITVWETDHFPFEWQPHFRAVDRVTFPNRWNVQAALLDLPGVDATFLPHPVLMPQHIDPPSMPSYLQQLENLCTTENPYVFYTINEFSGRKGVHLLLHAFIREFTRRDNVVLFIKTHGSVSEEVARELIERFISELDEPNEAPRILMDYTKWEDGDIHRLHEIGHCYVTLTRSEGHGLGACMAGLMGKRVVMTQYGGQTDYLEGIDWVPYHVTPASFCSLFDVKHKGCLDLPSCKYFRFFLPTHQNWALPCESSTRTILRRVYGGRLHGNSETPRHLERVCGERVVLQSFEGYFAQTMNAPSVTFPPRNLPDTYKRSSEYFKSQSSILSQHDLVTSAITVYGRRPRVTVIGCFGFGNMGDDLYAELHKSFLGQDFELRLCNTQTYVSKSSGGGLKWAKDCLVDDIEDTDYVVIGGGGILNDAELGSSIFTVYFPYCKARKIPISIVSVGFGFKPDAGKAPKLSDALRRGYAPLLAYANIITVRSLADRDAAMSLVPAERHFRIRVLADLVYGAGSIFPPGKKASVTRDQRYVIFCPTTYCSVQTPDVAMLLQKKLWENPDSPLLLLPLEGIDNVDTYPTRFVVEEMARLKALFPDIRCYSGRYANGEFAKLVGRSPPSDSTSQTLALCMELFRNASAVVSGRYHGLVLSKLFAKDVDTGTSGVVKIVEELYSPLDTDTWEDHYEMLKADIMAAVFVPPSETHLLMTDPELWDEGMRNTSIVDVITQSPAPEWSYSVPFIQALTNRQLWRRKQSMLTKRYVS